MTRRLIAARTDGPLFTEGMRMPNASNEKSKLRRLWAQLTSPQKARVRAIVARHIQACRAQRVAIEEMAVARTMIEASEMVLAGQDGFLNEKPEPYFPHRRYGVYVSPSD